MKEATDWDLWKAGLIECAEPPGRRSAAELEAMKGEGWKQNFARACDGVNRRWEAQHGPSKTTHRPDNFAARAFEALCERLGLGSD